ncbi:MAG: hypothetical protein [Wendovervirus sonii]|uniref:Peptidase MA superfamily protein n=1 Tax=phage Lak_Megaphage_Sonny TaxID=3109229 RepID=A0ABZ0Z4Z1_9CAUD|nr:MAG: hypothetical protein [phage Lak_Megaphage_Sonny]
MQLNEKAGVIEFANIGYRKEICQIAKVLKQTTEYNDILYLDNYTIDKVKKYTFNLSSLTWIDTIYIYYKFDRTKLFDAMALSNGDIARNLNLFKIDSNGHIKYGTIYITDDGTQNLTYVLFHEMCHIYDNSKFKEIWMNDLQYYLDNCNYDITNYNYYDDVSLYSVKDIHNVITECMRFANFTESHAFMENINFEMFEYLNKFNFNFMKFSNTEKIFMRSSAMLFDIYNLEKITGNLRYIDRSIKNEYMNIYQNEIKKAYYGFNSFDKIINYIYVKLHKIVSHARSLFDYYFNLDSNAKQIYELDEKFKFETYLGKSKRIK